MPQCMPYCPVLGDNLSKSKAMNSSSPTPRTKAYEHPPPPPFCYRTDNLCAKHIPCYLEAQGTYNPKYNCTYKPPKSSKEVLCTARIGFISTKGTSK